MHPELDAVDWVGLFAALVGSLILVPISLYTLIRFYQFRMVGVIKNRQKKLVYYMNILTISGLLFQWAKLGRNVWEIYMNRILTQVIYIFDGLFIWSVFALFCIKTWLLFYGKQYHEANADQIWKETINQQYISWYISNKQKWGNFDYIVKILIIPLICCVCLESILEVTFLLRFNIHSMIILSIVWLPPSCILQCVYLKGWDDIFGIKQEVFYQIILMVIILCIHVIQFLFQIKNITNSVDNPLVHRIDWLLAIIISSITLFSMSFISTAYPIHLYTKQQHRELNILHHRTSSGTLQQSDQPKGSWDEMLNVISDKNGFRVFMNYLVNEFATENLLFVLELIQVKCAFLDRNSYLNHLIRTDVVPFNPTNSLKKRNSFLPTMNMTISLTERKLKDIHIESYIFGNDNRAKPWGKIKFPFSLPQTEVLGKHSSLKNQFNDLYYKYVEVNSMHTINISYGVRKRLDLFFNPPEPEGMTENKKQQIILNQLKGIKLFRIQSESMHPDNHINDINDIKDINDIILNNNNNTNNSKRIDGDIVLPKHPNTPRESPKMEPLTEMNINDDHNNSPRAHTPSNSKSKEKSKSLKSISIGLPKHPKKAYQRTPSNKMPQELSEPIIEKDNFPDIELSMKSGAQTESDHEIDKHLDVLEGSISPHLNRDDIPDDFMVILDYNMDEGEKEDDDDGNGIDAENEDENEEKEVGNELNFNLDESEEKKEGSDDDEDMEEIDEEKMFELWNIMDSACIEVIGLMYGSYSRFTVTPNGKQLIKLLNKESAQ